ncbi:CidA/LrgA family protein [Pseudoalteromonas piscicida]|uniref:CidA/LrgA family protein n=1 Tax=Pseudoalteromonas piscicida TaxID=43662 RepID=A0A2A5JT13_PSEO7|nr:CidA/LrgA family protein [Pseudoalteromonas piscicida]
MIHIVKLILQFAVGFAVILGCLFSAKWVVQITGLQLPAALLGMIFLLILLMTKIIKTEWLAPAAEPILKYMALFFIPAGVGLVEHLGLFQSHWPMLLLLLFGVPTVSLVLLSPIVKKIKFRD